VLQKLLQHQGDDAPDPRPKNRRVPENLSTVVRKMMAKDPRRRYQTADQLVRDLLLVAGSLGLRSVSSEGLMWISAQHHESSFWERHFAWIGTAAALLAIVVYIEFRGPRLTSGPQPSQPPLTANIPEETAPLLATTGKGAPSTEAPRGTPAISPAPQEIIPVEAPQPRRRGDPPISSPAVEVAGGPMPTAPGSVVEDAVTAPARPVASIEVRRVFGPRIENGVAGLQPQTLDPHAVTRLAPEGPASSGSPRIALAPTPADFPPDPRPAANRTRPADSPLLAPGGIPEPAISIVGLDGTPKESFTTLEAACSAATDGSIIELRFNGRRRERPLHVKKKITIRAGKKYRPLIEFVPMDVPAEGPQTRMIRISSGAIDLVGVDLLMTVDESLSPDHWTLFDMQRPDYVRLQGVTLTINNPRQHPTHVFEFQPGLTSSMPDMGAGLTRPPLEVDLTGSLVRGSGDLFVIKSLEPARLSVKDSIVALQGSLLRSVGMMGSTPPEGGATELRIDHVTMALAGNLLQFDSGYLPRKSLPLQVSMSNSIVESISEQPLVSMTGEGPSPSMRSLLSWSGQKNFYDGFETFWLIASTDPSSKSERLDFNAWQKHWGSAMELGPRTDAVVWQHLWNGTPLIALTPADFELAPNASQNPAVSGATNGSDAGASLTNVAHPPSTQDMAAETGR
jgi:serine/threonine-protein kinase